MKKSLNHPALKLKNKKTIVFTAMSKRSFYMRMLVVKYVLSQDKVPICPFMALDYYLLDTVKRDLIRAANNNLLGISEELWVFGPISDGVMAEIKQAKDQKKPIKFFAFKDDKDIKETTKNKLIFEEGMERYKVEI